MSQTLNASILLAVPLAPLAGAVLAGFFGTTFGGNWIGRAPVAHASPSSACSSPSSISVADAQERAWTARASTAPSTSGWWSAA